MSLVFIYKETLNKNIRINRHQEGMFDRTTYHSYGNQGDNNPNVKAVTGTKILLYFPFFGQSAVFSIFGQSAVESQYKTNK